MYKTARFFFCIFFLKIIYSIHMLIMFKIYHDYAHIIPIDNSVLDLNVFFNKFIVELYYICIP